MRDDQSIGCSNAIAAIFVIWLVSRLVGFPMLGVLFLIVAGMYVFGRIARLVGKSGGDAGGNDSREDSEEDRKARAARHLQMLEAFSGLMAKLAKADGHVTDNEIRSIESAFQRMGLDSSQREHCIRAFRAAKDDSLSAQAYARKLRFAAPKREVRIFLYELLWELASSDGMVSLAEESILGQITYPLEIDSSYFDYCRVRYRFFRQANGAGGGRRGGSNQGGGRTGGGGGGAPRRDPNSLEAAYATLGVEPSASDDEVKKAYRAAAKKYHPDLLRAQGMSERLVAQAQEKMAAINDAWSLIRKSRATL